MSTRLTDDLWLAAHDSIKGTALVGEWPLGVGLAAGLLAELIHAEVLKLNGGGLFRKTSELPDDIALRPLLVQMQAEEREWMQAQERDRHAPSVRARARVRARPHGHEVWPPSAEDDFSSWLAPERDGPEWPPPRPAPGAHRESFPGHRLDNWIAYLAYEQRAEELVARRLARAGLATREERRRLLGRTRVRYVPADSYVAGTPAVAISTAVQRGLELPKWGLFVAGLFLVTGLHHHALALLTPDQHALLAGHLSDLDDESRELLKAADVAVGEAAMR